MTGVGDDLDRARELAYEAARADLVRRRALPAATSPPEVSVSAEPRRRDPGRLRVRPRADAGRARRARPARDRPRVRGALGAPRPDAVAEYASSARERGLKVLICGAGLAAALPGVVAAHTDLPVIGVPLRSSKSVLDGLDALLSIVQMPPGVPVACVGVDNARNAAVLAARILGASERRRYDRLE